MSSNSNSISTLHASAAHLILNIFRSILQHFHAELFVYLLCVCHCSSKSFLLLLHVVLLAFCCCCSMQLLLHFLLEAAIAVLLFLCLSYNLLHVLASFFVVQVSASSCLMYFCFFINL